MAYQCTVTVLTDLNPKELREYVADVAGVAEDDVVVTERKSIVNRERLIHLAAWAAGEKAKQDLGLPSEWDQRHWLYRNDSAPCGTACCIAGKVVVEDGGTVDWAINDLSFAGYAAMPDGRRVSVELYARAQLGLSEDEAGDLFRDTNDLDDILRIVGELIGHSETSE